MRIELVASTGGEDRGRFFLSTFLVGGRVAVDAGALGTLALSRQSGVRDVFLTHGHLDHVATLPLFLGNVFHGEGAPPRVHGSAATLESLRHDLFNDRLWPDLDRLAREGFPQVEWNVLAPERPVPTDEVTLTPVEVDHAVPTFGYILEPGRAGMTGGLGASGGGRIGEGALMGERGGSVAVIAGDTGPTDRLWQVARRFGKIGIVFLEVSFPDRLSDLALAAKHLTPRTFAAEIGKIGSGPRIVAVHLKPSFHDEVAAEIAALGLPNVEVGRPGESYLL